MKRKSKAEIERIKQRVSKLNARMAIAVDALRVARIKTDAVIKSGRKLGYIQNEAAFRHMLEVVADSPDSDTAFKALEGEFDAKQN